MNPYEPPEVQEAPEPQKGDKLAPLLLPALAALAAVLVALLISLFFR